MHGKVWIVRIFADCIPAFILPGSGDAKPFLLQGQLSFGLGHSGLSVRQVGLGFGQVVPGLGQLVPGLGQLVFRL